METESSPKGDSQFLRQMVETGASPASSSTSSTTAAASATSPPPSLSSSPSHDFTFTISLYPSPPKGPNKSVAKPRTSGNAIDLAPADDIFFHGHLLPLRLLTRPPFSPRRSAENLVISLDSNFTNVAEQGKANPSNELARKACDAKERIKASKSFSSLIMGLAKWRREADKEEEEEDIDRAKDKDKKKDVKKKKFDMKRMLKKYTSLVDALFPSRGMAKERRDIRQRPYSFSGVSNNWSRGGGGQGGGGGGGGGGRDDDCRRQGKKRWGQLSAPASMRTSPSNSGLLVPPPNLGSSDESTMEELQNAIQAAISHCKNSMNVKEEICKL